ncbi:hypothetical protein OK016_10335 [Vibrio chagasii]|nr:hypothetical protein [Vibrio chagasii]
MLQIICGTLSANTGVVATAMGESPHCLS